MDSVPYGCNTWNGWRCRGVVALVLTLCGVLRSGDSFNQPHFYGVIPRFLTSSTITIQHPPKLSRGNLFQYQQNGWHGSSSSLSAATTNSRNVRTTSEDELAFRILNGLSIKFPKGSVDRVIHCFERFNRGEKLDVLLDVEGNHAALAAEALVNDILLEPTSPLSSSSRITSEHNRQQANCWVDGIQPVPFHDIRSAKLTWAAKLEDSADIVRNEFLGFMRRESAISTSNDANDADATADAAASGEGMGGVDGVKEKKNNAFENRWQGSRNVAAGAVYGPQWKTLGLQDRGQWDDENVANFPETVKLLKSLDIPCCEAFFARQQADSGITPHSDQNNFIMTCHLGISVEKEKAWIRVGDETRFWEEGRVLVFDTSIFHSTRNNAATDRYVLLIRFWHPDLSPAEVQALEFIFEFLNQAALGDAAVQEFEAVSVFNKTEPSSSLLSPSSFGSASPNSVSLSRKDRRKGRVGSDIERKKKSKRSSNSVSSVSKGFGAK